jgi:hypothetical protein
MVHEHKRNSRRNRFIEPIPRGNYIKNLLVFRILLVPWAWREFTRSFKYLAIEVDFLVCHLLNPIWASFPDIHPPFVDVMETEIDLFLLFEQGFYLNEFGVDFLIGYFDHG